MMEAEITAALARYKRAGECVRERFQNPTDLATIHEMVSASGRLAEVLAFQQIDAMICHASLGGPDV